MPITVSTLLFGVDARKVKVPAVAEIRYQSTSFALIEALPLASPLLFNVTATKELGTGTTLGGTLPQEGVSRSSRCSSLSRVRKFLGERTGFRSLEERNIPDSPFGVGRGGRDLAPVEV